MKLFQTIFESISLSKLLITFIKLIFVFSMFAVTYALFIMNSELIAFVRTDMNSFILLAVFLLSFVVFAVAIVLQKKRHRKTWNQLNNKFEQLQGKMGELEVMALNDCGTGLPGRFRLLDFIDNELGEDEAHIAFCIINLDDLRHINDTLGYKIGDQVISITAQRLAILADKWQRMTSFSTYVSCLGRDEFVLLIMNINHQSELVPLLEDLLIDIKRCIELGKEKIFIGASIGVCFNTKAERNSEDLLRKADIALSKVKKSNKHSFAFFKPKYLQALETEIKTESEIRSGLSLGEFEVYYQPIIDTHTGNELGFEALVRWNHPERGLVFPDEFISVAEKTGLIVPLGEWVMKQACSDLSVLQVHNRDYFIAINIAPLQLSDPCFIQKVQAIITCYALRSEQIHFELTETTLMNADQQNLRILREINNLGIKLWIDDFGTGYSSFSYLHNFRFHGIKLDRVFIEDVVSSERSQNIVRGICAMGDALKLELLGEGIEEPAQADFLLKLGCHHVQGYWYAKPMSRTLLHAWLLSWNKCNVNSTEFRLNGIK